MPGHLSLFGKAHVMEVSRVCVSLCRCIVSPQDWCREAMARAILESPFVQSLDVRAPNWWMEPPLENLCRQFARAYRLLLPFLRSAFRVLSVNPERFCRCARARARSKA